MSKSRYARIAAPLAAASVLLSIAVAPPIYADLPTKAPPPPPLAWQACPDSPTRDCATLTVPLDYADLSKGTIDLPVVRAPATDPATRIGAIFYNPGGPGVPVSGTLKDPDLTWLFNAQLLSRFDIVGVDPRGTTNGIECVDTAFLEQYWETSHLPRTDAEIGNLMGLERQYNRACRDNNLPLIKHVDTASVVRDMEQLRRAAGLATFSYFGNSYGTFIGYRYARLYPGKLRALVLDAVVDRSSPDQQHIEESNRSFDSMWQQFKTWCHATASCRMRGRDIEGDVDTLMAQARVNPLPAPRAPFTTRPANDWILTFALQFTTQFGDITFNWVDQVISEALLDNDASVARYIYDISTGATLPGGEYFPDRAQRRTITCLDTNWSNKLVTIADVKKLAAKLRQDSPRLGESNTYQVTNCFGYPIEPIETPPLQVSLTNPPPILVVGGSRDASTPLLWAQRMASKLAGSRLLVRDGYGHGSYGKSRCIQQHVDSFFINLTLPPAGTVCPTDPDLYPPQAPLLQ
jgi:pimeloyl-ACP methyl ester carboxylesterase